MSRDSKTSDEPSTWLFVLPWSLEHVGGVNQVVLNLYRQLSRHGAYRPLVMIQDWSATSPLRSSEKGCDVVRLRFRGPPHSFADVIGWLVFGLRETVRIWRFIRRENVAVINVHYFSDSVFPLGLLKAFRLYRGALVLSFHGMDLDAAARSAGISRWAHRFLARQADRICACSHALAAAVEDVFPDGVGKAQVVHNGVDEESVEAVTRAEFEESEISDNYIVNFATYEHKKGQDVLIKAFALLCDEFPEYSLVMAGRDAGARQSLLDLTEEFGIGDRVRILDAMPHEFAMSLFRGASAMVLPSRYEPFGIVVLEAGLQGVPVIASRVGGVEEIISSPEYGVLLSPDDPNALAEAIRDVLLNPERARVRAEALRKRILEEFTWQKARDSMIRLVHLQQGRR